MTASGSRFDLPVMKFRSRVNVRIDGKDIGERELRFEELRLHSLVEGKVGSVMQLRALNYATRHIT